MRAAAAIPTPYCLLPIPSCKAHVESKQIKKKEVIMSVSVMQNMQNLEKKRIDLAYELKQKQKKQEYILSLAWLVFVTINILLPLLFLLLVVFIYKHNCKKLQIKAERIVNECR